MQNDYNSHKLDVLGDISVELLESIYQKVTISKHIERKFIHRILREKKT